MTNQDPYVWIDPFEEIERLKAFEVPANEQWNDGHETGFDSGYRQGVRDAEEQFALFLARS